MTIALCILIVVSSILAGWFAGRYWELTFWIRRCRAALSVLKTVEQQGVKPFVVIAQSDEFCDYIADAAYGHRVSESAIQECIEPYIRDNRFTLVFYLNGEPPRILPNSEKG